MKRIILPGLLALMLFACQPKDTTVKIEGKVENLNSSFLLLSSKGLTDTILVDDNGQFNKSIELESPAYFTLKADRANNTLYLTPGNNLTINLNIKESEKAPEYIGDNADINAYIFEANSVINKLMSDFRELYTLPREEFIEKTDSVKNKLTELLSKRDFEQNSFNEMEKSRIDYRIKGMLYDYPNYNARLNGMEHTFNAEEYEFINKVDFNKLTHLSIPEYASLITKHLQTLYYNNIADDKYKGMSKFEKDLVFYDIVDSLIMNQTIRDYAKHYSTIQTIQWSDLEIAKKVAEHFTSKTQTREYKKVVQNVLDKRLLLAPGKVAPKFTLTDIDGNVHSLSDFKGQIVYIDFWATWCGPCLQEIPYLKKVKEAYTDKPVAFVAISLDDNKENWEKMVADKSLEGYQLYAEKAWFSDVAQKYQIKGIPTFVLIDGEGTIIEYPAAHPSDPELPLVLDKHIKEL
ncbi:MAG: TlpA family protein disulfide reductase [Bacteroidales bacterium]